MHSGGVSQEPSQGTLDGAEVVHTLSKETPGSPDASELGSPRCTPNFDLFNMVVSYKRMALFLEPITDAVELTRFLLGCVCVFVSGLFEHLMIKLLLSLSGNGRKPYSYWSIQCHLLFFFSLSWKMPVCSLLVCVFLNVFFCTVNEGKMRHATLILIQLLFDVLKDT